MRKLSSCLGVENGACHHYSHLTITIFRSKPEMRMEVLFIVGPEAKDFYDSLLFEDLVDEAMLNVYSP